MKKRIVMVGIVIAIFMSFNLYGFDNGFIWTLKANFSGTITTPSISKADLDKLTATYMKGGLGFFMDGEAELGYLFGSEKFFNMDNAKVFSGMSAFTSIGIGNGATFIQSGSNPTGDEVVDVYFNVRYKLVVSFGVGTKVYLFDSRFAVGLAVGGKLIADTSPGYEFYAQPSLESVGMPNEVGTLIVTPEMMKKMNPVMGSIKISFEYNQPIIERMEVIIGVYGKYNIYSPGYITMPPKFAEYLEKDQGLDLMNTPMKSYFINSIDLGVSFGVGFKA